MKQSETFFTPKNADNYVCEFCDYNTYRKYDYEKHTLTQKHKMKQCETKCNKNVSKNATPKTHHKCTNCNNYFNCRSTLWRHKKTCNKPLLETNINPIDLVNFLMKDNTEFKQFMIEQNKQIIEMSKISGNNNNNNNTTNKNYEKIIRNVANATVIDKMSTIC
jgi:hypothetical protein